MTTEEKKWDRKWVLKLIAVFFVNPLGVSRNKILETLSENCPEKEMIGEEDISILIKTSSKYISEEEVKKSVQEIVSKLEFLEDLFEFAK